MWTDAPVICQWQENRKLWTTNYVNDYKFNEDKFTIQFRTGVLYFDAHNHVEGSCPKEWVAERHNYHAMAFLSRAYNFQWSRWNATAGSRNIVMQLREAVDKKREGKFQLLYVSPQMATILKCNELSQEFATDPAVGMQFFPDLFTLNMKYGSVDARRTTFSMKYRLVETVFEMLQELKLSSYS
ncbi:unnamed protein product [Leptidea sinapis]|uniref:CASC1 C-terminal domain-containing protein n=1 Tax=Leptidea sinapis TaxID=189913 RepID=A0A5E4QKK4_9NEOP|nr:unnamed protein product [Leptidea sinapis]